MNPFKPKQNLITFNFCTICSYNYNILLRSRIVVFWLRSAKLATKLIEKNIASMIKCYL